MGCCWALIMFVCLFQSISVSHAGPLREIQVPHHLSPALMYLLNQADLEQQAPFDSEKVIELLNYTAFHINVPKKDERHKWL